MLTDIEKETVDFVPNYDDKLKEPDVLPSRFPNLLVNGSAGIAVGMATNIPPHNLTEVIDGITAVIDDPMITIEELMEHIQGPDFPTGGVIMGRGGIRNAYTTGRGRIILRAKAEIEEHNGGHRIVVTEIPYQVNKSKLEKHINELKNDGKIEGITSTRDESAENIRLIINLSRNANPNVVLNNLYKYTQMQDTFGVILLALVDKEPKILNLREMIDHYIAHQQDVIRRRTQFELNKALKRAHILEGYKIIIDNIEEAIQIIRASKNIPDAKTALCKRFGLSEEQADEIVKMQLGRLSGLERDKIDEEYNEITARIADYRDILADESRVLTIIKEDLSIMKNKYGDERRTEISRVSIDLDDDDLIDEEDIVVAMTHKGYVKRMPIDTYRSQKRGGRGITGMSTGEEDFVEHVFTTTTHHTILFFTNRGVVYKLRGYQLPEAGRTAKGSAIVNLLPLEGDEKVTAMIPIKEFEDGKFLTFITRNGIVKKTGLMDYSRIRNGGLRAIELDEGDELIRVKVTDNTQDIILATHDGYAIRFNEKEVRSTGRTTRGVMGIRLHSGDYVIGASVPREGSQLLTVTENGYGKKTLLDEYRIQSRGGKGIFTYRITDKTGKLAGMKAVTDEDDIILITSDGIIIRMHTDEISSYSRQTQGVRVMKLAQGVKVVSIARTDREEENEEDIAEGTTENAEEIQTEGDNE